MSTQHLRRLLLIVFVSFVLVLPLGAAHGRDGAPDSRTLQDPESDWLGITPGNVREVLGLPSTVIIEPDASVAWQYETPQLTLRFAHGRVAEIVGSPDGRKPTPQSTTQSAAAGRTILQHVDEPSVGTEGKTARALYGRARAALFADQVGRAAIFLRRCTQATESINCRTLYEEIVPEYASQLAALARRLEPADLHGRLALLTRASALDPSLSGIAEEIARVREELGRARRFAREYLDRWAGVGIAELTARVSVSLPPFLGSLTDYLPELAQAHKRSLTLGAARLALAHERDARYMDR